jgi:curved DNA-binding protein CbpA
MRRFSAAANRSFYTMQGKLSQHPLVEILREVTADEWTGALRLTQGRVKIVLYFERGKVVSSIANLKQYRLAECLRRAGRVTDAQLQAANSATLPDAKLAQQLIADGVIDRATFDSVTHWQTTEILTLILQWPDGEWQLEARVRPAEKANIAIDFGPLLLEAARKLPPAFARQRLQPETDIIDAAEVDLLKAPVNAQEGYLLTRVTEAIGLAELTAISGLPPETALPALYALLVGGYLRRREWISAFNLVLPETAPVMVKDAAQEAEAALAEETAKSKRELESYLSRMEFAQDFYQMLGLENDAELNQVKDSYYKLARRFHPDLFHAAEPVLRSRIESEFARITRAYETLKDETKRKTYDLKLANNPKSAVPPAPKPQTPSAPPPASEAPRPVQPPPSSAPQPPPISAAAASAASPTPPAQTTPKVPFTFAPRPTPERKPATPRLTFETNPAAPFLARNDNRQDAFQMPRKDETAAQKIDAQMQKRAAEQFQRGLAALASRDYVSAVTSLAEAARLDPTQPRHHAYFGRALSRNPKSHRQAENELKEALEMEPHNTDYRVMLAEFYGNAGFPLRAQGEVQRVLEKDPLHPEARALRDKLAAEALKK